VGEITSALKIRRKVIAVENNDIIDAKYEGGGED
jgi:hypothetical protein